MSTSQPAVDSSQTETSEKLSSRQHSRFPWQFLTSNRVLGICVGSVALGLGLYRIGEPSLWFDEMLSVERATQPLPVLWNIVNASQPNMALYYFILHGWLSLTSLLGFHPTEAVVRLPSAIFAAGATVVVFLFARRLLGLFTGLTGAALYAFSTTQLTYTQDTRSYALQLLFLVLGWYALVAALTSDKHQRHWLVCYVVAMTLSVYTHYFSLLVIFAQAVALVCLLLLPTPWRTRTRRLFRPLFFSLLSIIILVIPMLFASRVGAQTDWIPIPGPADIVRLFQTFSNQDKNYLSIIEILTGFGLLVGVLASFTRSRRLLTRVFFLNSPQDQRATRYQLIVPFGLILICWLWVPIIVSYIVTQKSIHLFLSRYLVAVVPAFALLALLGLMAIPWRWARTIITLCLIAFAITFIPQYYASAQVEQWNTGALWVEHHYQPDDGLVCFDNLKGCQVGMEYYFSAYPTLAHFDADSPGSFSYVEYDLHRPNYRPDTTQAANPVALQKYAQEHPRLFYIVAHLNQNQAIQAASAVAWLQSHYQLISSIHAGTVTVYLYNTQTGKPSP